MEKQSVYYQTLLDPGLRLIQAKENIDTKKHMLDSLLILTAYLLGSLSSAIIVCRILRLPDPRTAGSNNPGATNVLRIGGKSAAAITLLGDSLKGLLPLLACHYWQVEVLTFALVGMAVFLGHLYPVFFGFQGGKGVATTLGIQFGLAWQIGGSVALIWLLVAKVMKMSSLAALLSMALAPIMVWLFWPAAELLMMQILMSALLLWRHRSNIRNLLAGTEDKITSD